MDFDTKVRFGWVNSDNSQVIIDFQGDMETFYTKFFMADMSSLMDSEKALKTVYMDFNEVKYVSSSFIACLLQIINKANLSDMEIFFLNLNEGMRKIIDTMGLAHFVKEIDFKNRKAFDIVCKKCKKRLSVKTTGEFACPHCGTKLTISKRGVVK
jgi:anti-anti-sigma factor